MEIPPPIDDIKRWLVARNPLWLFKDEKRIIISDIDPKPWSGHFNYLVTTGDRKFVLRLKGPEWGRPEGAVDEYRILKKIAPHHVGPAVYYLNKDFFGEPMFFEEYLLDATPINKLSPHALQKAAPDIARFIARINAIRFRKNGFPFQEAMTSYTRHKNAWRTRLEVILDCRHTKTCGQELLAVLPGIESRLNEFDERLRRILKATGPVFIFESAHVGHCVQVEDGFRFYNWEQVSYGDPSYTLAVFLTSLKDQKNFETIKRKMISAYLGVIDVPEFTALIDQRLWERHVSNIIYT
ncbi:MAG: aminoglycoside phosphotransferase family protein, partial [Candidatus Sungiibacteriota bacterium]